MDQQTGNTGDTGTNREHEMHAYFIQQGEGINRVYGILYSSAFVRGFGAVFSLLLEILLYLLFIFAIILIIVIPTSITVPQDTQGGAALSSVFTSQELSNLLITLKIIIFFISLPLLLCGILLRRNRYKNAVIGKAFSEADSMKKSFDQALQNFRF